MMRTITTPLLLLVACTGTPPQGPGDDAVAVEHNLPGEDGKRAAWEPLEAPDFKMPEVTERTLSNGLKVRVVTHSETPLWDLRLLFDVGGFTDPEGKEGLAEVTLDMMNEGAAGLSAEQISRKSTTLGSTIGTGAGFDGASVSASGIKRNLGPTLDLWASVLLQPEFPDDDWEIVRKRRVAELVAEREDPTAIARKAFRRVLYGKAYRGRPATEASYAAITTADMRAWYSTHLGPANAMILVGGDVTADEIVPLLEAKLGSWKPEGIQDPAAQVTISKPPEQVLYFIDKPGAAQSVIRMGSVVGTRGDDDWFDFAMGNLVLGGAFTSRVNMNLREDKGYTYGARCGSIDDVYGPGLWYCAASVKTAETGPSLTEFKNEVEGILGDKPVTADELAFFQSFEVNGFPKNYETTGAILGEQSTIWQYGLPNDWPERFIPGVQGVTVDSANGALKSRLSMDHVFWLVVGDKSVVFSDIEAFGARVVELDRDGNPLGG